LEEINFELVESRGMLCHWDTSELREGRLEVNQFERIRPVVLIRCSQNFKNLEYLIDLRISHEQRSTLNHLGEDAAGGPSVNSERVSLLAKENLGASVPERDNFVSISLNGKTESAGESKISKLDVLSSGVNKQVLWLQVTMEDSVLVQVDERLKDLVQEALSLLLGEGLITESLHIFLEIELQVLEHEVELVLRVDDLFEPI